MRYYLDTEFNGLGGDLISLALVSEDDRSFYAVVVQEKPSTVFKNASDCDHWVQSNVLPILADCPVEPVALYREELPSYLADFLGGDVAPVIVTDWPDDIRYFCEAVITGPGTMINIPGLKFEMHRVDAYPTSVEGAVQHNAWWDAVALKAKLTI